MSADFILRAVLVLASAFFAHDIFFDVVEMLAESRETGRSLSEYDEFSHLLIETLIFIVTIAALAYAQVSMRRATKTMQAQEQQLVELSSSVAQQISGEFDRWTLTDSERDVAWLIIKGYSFNEIAGFRGVKEKTVRQQASNVYTKAGTSNRAEFSAMFLEDLLANSAPEVV